MVEGLTCGLELAHTDAEGENLLVHEEIMHRCDSGHGGFAADQYNLALGKSRSELFPVEPQFLNSQAAPVPRFFAANPRTHQLAVDLKL